MFLAADRELSQKGTSGGLLHLPKSSSPVSSRLSLKTFRSLITRANARTISKPLALPQWKLNTVGVCRSVAVSCAWHVANRWKVFALWAPRALASWPIATDFLHEIAEN